MVPWSAANCASAMPAMAMQVTQGDAVPVQQLHKVINERVEKLVRANQQLASGIPFWGQNLFTEPETEKLSALLTKAKEFLESLQAYNTPGKLKNFKYDATDIKAYQATFTRLTACNSSKEACARLVSPPNRASRASAAGFPASVESSSALLTCSQDSIGPSRSPPTEANSNTV
jgi:hypothetical protein